ncbi:hypothetical protein FOZ62_026877 [Perkinsus olseni]|uniref:Uncharacterized protein n=1 Tax=Perkinsus olseni TaxID=32597 RepID=A0A7J6SM69_PEROL|nr:hypothetical protein FOZ62_026877 [Perkinsus olseni]
MPRVNESPFTVSSPIPLSMISMASKPVTTHHDTPRDDDEVQVNQPLIGSVFASEMATRGFRVASDRVAAAANAIDDYIHAGPDSLRLLAFLGGLAVTITGALNVLSPAQAINAPVIYLLNAYQTVFGVVTCLLEADPKYLHKYEVQQKIHEYAHFLTQLWGRGFFYVFQASIALMHLTFLYVVVGVYMGMLGLLSISLYFKANDGDTREANRPVE